MTQYPYEIVYCPAADQPVAVLHATTDPNKATVLFDTELRRLRTAGETGDVLMRTVDDDPRVLLRESAARPVPPVTSD